MPQSGKDLADVIFVNRNRGELHVGNAVGREKRTVTRHRLYVRNRFDSPPICFRQLVEKARLAMRDHTQRVGAIRAAPDRAGSADLSATRK